MKSDEYQIVNVSVANLYKEPVYQSELITQAILGEKLKVIDKADDFYRVEQIDGYTGWINLSQICEYRDMSTELIVRSHCIQVFEQCRAGSDVIRDAVIGTRLEKKLEQNNWIEVILPDTTCGWIPSEHFGSFAELCRESVVELAREFLGYPYFWGGKSPKGFDCSGLTQCVFGLLGKLLPRDSWMQAQQGNQVSEDYRDAQPGDLLFFADSGTRVNHVGIAIGNKRIIHARGMVRINSFDENDKHFSRKLQQTFLTVKAFI